MGLGSSYVRRPSVLLPLNNHLSRPPLPHPPYAPAASAAPTAPVVAAAGGGAAGVADTLACLITREYEASKN